ncbi:GNAT family N-acetyltransferase [Psychrobacillus sp. FJAT-21963]|uniref:GNAT family N-acetyltransferase n=1 Tax=Psychrobacillus sp. FJAT-21963 TaxID=1712028 RepID=UPI0006FDAD82|nr:GNAT family N-acetyltransferase [Psychrobacillus sp. FJAT-21963]
MYVSVYSGLWEVSIYIHLNARGKGIGNLLLQALIKKSDVADFWTLQAAIFPENNTSIQPHKKNGYRIIGIRERIGKVNGIWRDNLFLERRSVTVGVDLLLT